MPTPEAMDALHGLWQSVAMLSVGLVAARDWLEAAERDARYVSWLAAYA